ncbi:hypothetical protein YC2023_022060 [Brassica napus]
MRRRETRLVLGGCGGKYLLPWIYSIMVNHRHYIMSQEPKEQQLLTTLHKINKAAGNETQTRVHEQESDEMRRKM